MRFLRNNSKSKKSKKYKISHTPWSICSRIFTCMSCFSFPRKIRLSDVMSFSTYCELSHFSQKVRGYKFWNFTYEFCRFGESNGFYFIKLDKNSANFCEIRFFEKIQKIVFFKSISRINEKDLYMCIYQGKSDSMMLNRVY